MNTIYQSKNSQLTGRNNQSRKIAHNTYLLRIGDDIGLKYHDTIVCIYKQDGSIILDSGGWYTKTTKERLQMALQSTQYGISQKNGVWYIWLRNSSESFKFKDGMALKPNGKISGAAKDLPKADIKLKAKIKAYAAKCAESIPLEKPSGGDCWYCSMITDNKQSLGDAFKDKSHITSHLKESYIVPSLVYNALKESGNSDSIIYSAFNNDSGTWLTDIARDRVKSGVYKYILKRLGYCI